MGDDRVLGWAAFAEWDSGNSPWGTMAPKTLQTHGTAGARASSPHVVPLQALRQRQLPSGPHHPFRLQPWSDVHTLVRSTLPTAAAAVHMHRSNDCIGNG